MAKRTASSKLSRKVASRKSRKKRSLPKRKNPSAAATADGIVSNTWAELAGLAVPGLCGYAVARGAGWLTYRVVKSKSPKFAKHAGPLGSIAAAIAASYATRRFDQLKQYDTPVIVGAWVAATQSVLQTYVPALSWVLGDWNMTEFLAPAKAAAQNSAEPVPIEGYTKAYAEAFGPEESAAPLPEATGDDTFDDIPGLNDTGMNVGIFSGGLSN